jgi:hypothetical protein
MAYKVVPFKQTNNVAGELLKIINAEEVGGYKYVNHQYSDKSNPGSNGCFGIGGQPPSTDHIGFVLFENKE